MDGAKQVYEVITNIWNLWKKYGGNQLNDQQWESFVQEGQQLHKKFEQVDSQIDLLYRDMFMALQNYYGRKETSKNG